MSVLRMHPLTLSGDRLGSLRILVLAAALGAGALVTTASPAASKETAARTQKPGANALAPQKATATSKVRAPHKKRGGACTSKKVVRQHKKPQRKHAAKRRVPLRRAKPSQAAQTFEIPQGDGSPVLSAAAQLLGRPYRFGSARGAFDCSGFVRTVFEKLGIELPHSARDQFTLGDRVTRDALEPGDLVFFRTYRRTASHVGIYVGDDKFVHAATRGGQVQVDSLSDGYYAQRYLGAKRIRNGEC